MRLTLSIPHWAWRIEHCFSAKRWRVLSPGFPVLGVHTRSGRHLLRVTLSHLEQRLDPMFARVHRTAIVNVNEVVELREEERLVLVLSNGARVPVSRSRRRDVEPVLRPRLRPSPPPRS